MNVCIWRMVEETVDHLFEIIAQIAPFLKAKRSGVKPHQSQPKHYIAALIHKLTGMGKIQTVNMLP